MFPIPFNFPFIRKDGSRTTIGAAIDASGSDPYTLPTASTTTKGGVKIGNGLEMDGEVLNATGGGGTQLYYKDFENVTISGGWTQYSETGLYHGNINDIGVNGYTPIAVTAVDKYSGYSPSATLFKSGTDGADWRIYLEARKSNASNSFNIRVYYIADTDLTPIPTT